MTEPDEPLTVPEEPAAAPHEAPVPPVEPSPAAWVPTGAPPAAPWQEQPSEVAPDAAAGEVPAPEVPVADGPVAEPPVPDEVPVADVPVAAGVHAPVPAWVPAPARPPVQTPDSPDPAPASPAPLVPSAPVVLSKASEPGSVPTATVLPSQAEPPVPSEPAETLEPAETREPDEAVDGRAAGSSARNGLLVPVLAALMVVLLGLTGFLGWKVFRPAGSPAVQASGSQALTAAREAARLVFSYDYRHLDQDFTAGRAVTTGAFQQEYDRTTKKLVDDVAPRYKAVVSADVSEAGVVRATEDQVVCLVFVNQTSTSSLASTPKITQSRLEMTLQRVEGTWLVAKIDAL